MESDLRNSRVGWAAHALNLARPLVEGTIRRALARTVILATIMEDLPYADNRLVPPDENELRDGSHFAMEYRIRAYDRVRIAQFRARMRQMLRPYRFMLLKQAENNQLLGHICGTCRFGTDDSMSVLDPNNRVHGLKNLYVVDSSFLPSSSGTNPSLTIAANALRLAVQIQNASGCDLQNPTID
jgi:choline dehydrogenase-like flavoprotein